MPKLNAKPKKVFVSGCFDLLHSGHIAFLQEAATYGQLYVGIGSDDTIKNLKGRYPIYTQSERMYMIQALACVQSCIVNSGSGILDFLPELDSIQPDILIVNEDGHTPAKAELCKKRNIEYMILKRIPNADLPKRSTTSLRTECNIPFRIDIAGGWLDQPYVSKYHPGAVITISIEPTIEFNQRSGMASSTRQRAIELWKTDLPPKDPEQLAKILFTFDNPPGKKEISGSQDALGIVMPGLNKLNYNNDYWPCSIESVHDPQIIAWLESHLNLITLGPRISSYNVLDNTKITVEGAKRLANATENCWKAISAMNLADFGQYFRASFEAQIAMFPNMVDGEILHIIDQYRDKAYGWKLSGAGGGGYLILVTDKPIESAIRIKIRRKEFVL
jgi:cytidyltransferase-like protein